MLLKKIIEFKNGKKKPSSKGSIPIYGGNGILGYTDQNNQNGESLIIGRVGAYCGCVYSHYGKCWISDNAIVGKVNDGNDFYYCYYLLKRLNLNSRHVGSGQPLMTQEILNNIEINICDYETQRKIGKILKNIDDKVKINNKINNNLYEEAVALYKDKFKGIGQGKKTIGDYIVPKRGKNLLTRDAIDGDTPVVAGGIDPSAYHNQFNTKSPVITISASVANAGYTNLWNIPVWASDCSYIDDSITKNVYFWYIVLKTRQNEIFDAQTGSAQPHIYPQHIAEMSIGELNIAEIEKYNNLVAPLFKMIGENQQENKKLSELRDTLLPKLMNGEIDLDNIEI